MTFRWLQTTLLSLPVPSWPCWGDTAILPAIDFSHATYGFIDIYSISSQAGETYLFNNSPKKPSPCCFFLCVCSFGMKQEQIWTHTELKVKVCTDTLIIYILVFVSWAQITLVLFHHWICGVFFIAHDIVIPTSASEILKKSWQFWELSWIKLLKNKCEAWSLRHISFSRVLIALVAYLVLTACCWKQQVGK